LLGNLAIERMELETDLVAERRELSSICVGRGLEPVLAQRVAELLMAHDALGISATRSARPIRAAWASAGSFAARELLPLAASAASPAAGLIPWVSRTSLACPASSGAGAAGIGGAGIPAGAWRISFCGALALAITAGIGKLVGAVVEGEGNCSDRRHPSGRTRRR
jgi:vacuolar iron transporter family protein